MPRIPNLPWADWRFLFPLIVLAVYLTTPAAAQGPALAIDQASLRLWPEYDDPGLLVILSGTFTGTAKFPQQVAFPSLQTRAAPRRRSSIPTATCSASNGR